MGKTHLLCRELVRCASQMLLTCSEGKLFRAHQRAVQCHQSSVIVRSTQFLECACQV